MSEPRHPPTTSTRTGTETPVYATDLGFMLVGDARDSLRSDAIRGLAGKVDLVFTSPPFPLRRKKRYGNLSGEEYLEWLSSFAPALSSLLSPTGSIVLELGNAWESGAPVMSTLPMRALLRFLETGNLNLCEEFVCHNPARLPGPAQWVTVERIRVKDAFTRLWWMSPSARPKADNRRVLAAYGHRMLKLLKDREYNSGKRPSEHSIGASSFLRNNGGAIPSNVLTIANTSATDSYQRYCRANGFRPHPARMPSTLAEFFIKLLTEPGDTVLDPFAGSNVTGAIAERLGRRWVAIEMDREYAQGSVGRFEEGAIQGAFSAASSG